MVFGGNFGKVGLVPLGEILDSQLFNFISDLKYLQCISQPVCIYTQVKWRPVVWGLAMQFLFALIILRWDAGYEAFKWLGDRVAEFLAHTDEGSTFVFDDINAHFFAFAVSNGFI